jgi:hypothetical protein
LREDVLDVLEVFEKSLKQGVADVCISPAHRLPGGFRDEDLLDFRK